MQEQNRPNAPQHERGSEQQGSIISEYIVEEKDTLDDIAQRYGVSIEEIMAANRETIHDTADLAKPGQRINIPNKSRH